MENIEGGKNLTNLGDLSTRLTFHILENDRTSSELKESIKELVASVENFKSNHFVHLKDSISSIEVSLTKNTIDTEWLKKFFWIVATASVGSLVASILNLI